MNAPAEILALTGELTVDSAPTVLATAIKNWPKSKTIAIDLSALERVDSAAVAAMLAWMREAESKAQTLRFQGLSPSLLSLVQAYDLESVLLPAVTGSSQ